MPIANHMVGLRSYARENEDKHKFLSQTAADTILKITAMFVGLAVSFLIARIALLLNGHVAGDLAADTVFKLTQPLIVPFKALTGLPSSTLISLGGEIMFCLIALAAIFTVGWALVRLFDGLVNGFNNNKLKREDF